MAHQIIRCFLTLAIFFVGATLKAETPKVLATTSIIADITEQLGAPYISVTSLVPVGGDPHLYEPIPQDVKTVVDSDLILVNGLNLEGWINELLENSGTKAPIVVTTQGIDPIKSTAYDNAPDPHAWMNVQHGIKYAENIRNALVNLVPDQGADIQKNYEAYLKKLITLDQEITTQINTLPENLKVLITSHDAFQYYGKRYGLKLESVQGMSTDSDIQTSDIENLYSVIKDSKIPVVFIESTINPKVLKQIAEDTGAKIGGKLYADSLGDPDSESGTYIGMIRSNTNTIVLALLGNTVVAEETESPTQNYWLTGILILAFLAGIFFMTKKLRK